MEVATHAEASQRLTGDRSSSVGATRSATSPIAIATTYRIGAGAITPALSGEGLAGIGMAEQPHEKHEYSSANPELLVVFLRLGVRARAGWIADEWVSGAELGLCA